MEKIQNHIFVDEEEDNEPTFKRVVDLKVIGQVLRERKIIKGDSSDNGELEKILG